MKKKPHELSYRSNTSKICRRFREDSENTSKTSKRKRVQSLQANYLELQIPLAFISILRVTGKIKLANKISQIVDSYSVESKGQEC